MSWCDGPFRSASLERETWRRRAAGLAGLAALALLPTLQSCTVQPLYATRSSFLSPGVPADLADLRSRISVAQADSRSAQIVRNALVTAFSGAGPVAAPLYEVRFSASGYETVVAIQQGSGIPSASLYQMNVTFSVLRLADTKVIASGTRFATAPFDRTRQLYAASRAVLDARDRAGRLVAGQVELAALSAIRKDIAAGPQTVAVPPKP